MKLFIKFILCGLLCGLLLLVIASVEGTSNRTLADTPDQMPSPVAVTNATYTVNWGWASQFYAFPDVPSTHWAYSVIGWGTASGYIQGYADGTFKPNANITRAEFLKIVVTALRLPIPTAVAPDSSWYAPYIVAATSDGIYQNDFTSGTMDTPITRQEMSMIGVRATDSAIRQNTKYDPLRYMFTATSEGLIKGEGNGELGEKLPTTRAEAVAVIQRILSINNGNKLTVDKHAVDKAEVLWHKTNIFSVAPEIFGKPYGYSEAPIDHWSANNMFVQSPDGDYRFELDYVILVDMDDPKDPYRYMLGDVSTLKWFNLRDKFYPISNYPNTYVMLYGGRTVFNKNTAKYSSDIVPFGIAGILNPDMDAFYDGLLNTGASIIRNKLWDFNGFLIPKNFVSDGIIDLHIYTPNIGDSTNKVLIEVDTDTKK